MGRESSRYESRGERGAGERQRLYAAEYWWKCARTAFRWGAVQPAATAMQWRVIGRLENELRVSAPIPIGSQCS